MASDGDSPPKSGRGLTTGPKSSSLSGSGTAVCVRHPTFASTSPPVGNLGVLLAFILWMEDTVLMDFI